MKFSIIKVGLAAVFAVMLISPVYAGGHKQSQKTDKVEVSGTEAKIIDILLRKGIITSSEAKGLKGDLIAEKQKEKAEMAKSIEEKTKTMFKVPQIGTDKMKLSGFIKFRNSNYWGHKTDRSTITSGKQNYDTFSIGSSFLSLKGEAADDWNYGIGIDPNSLSNNSHLRDMWIQYTDLPYGIKIKAGQFKVPFSEEHLTPTTKLDTIQKAEVVASLCSFRDIGVQISGDTLDKKVNYALGVFNGNNINTTDNNDQKDIIGRVVVSPFKGDGGSLDGLSFGVSAQGGRQPNSTSGGIAYAGDRTRVGGLIKYVGKAADKNFKLQSEYIYQSRDQQDTGACYKSQGWYVLTTYDLTDKWQPVYKYEVYDPDEKATGDKRKTNTLGINYFFNKHTKLQLNYRNLKYPNSKGGNELLSELTIQF